MASGFRWKLYLPPPPPKVDSVHQYVFKPFPKEFCSIVGLPF